MIASRLTVLSFAAAVLAATVAGGARAAEGFDVVEAGSAVFPNQAYVVVLDQKRGLTTDDVTVTENGTPVRGAAVQSAATAEGIGTVLLIDASNSMRSSIGAAMAAARAFVARNPGQPLSVVTFNTRPTVALPLTTDRKLVNAALARAPRLAEGTRIYDALAAAIAQIRDAKLGAGRIVLLSDGDDVGSVTTRDSAIAQLNDQKVRVFTVGIKSPDFTPAELEDIAAATGASYAQADSPKALRGLYDQLGLRLSYEYLLVYRSSADPDEKVKVEVAIAGLGAQSLSYTTPKTGSGSPYEKPLKDKVLQSFGLMLLLVLLVVSLAAYALQMLLHLRSNRRLRARLGDFVTLPEEERARERQREVNDVLAVVSERSRRSNSQWLRSFAEDVDVADLATPPQRLLLWGAAGGLVVAVLVGALLSPWAALLGLLVPLGVRSEVGRRAGAMRRKFGEQLPDNLEVMASALRAGHSLVGAMSVVVDEAPKPAKREFRRIVADEQLGITLDAALEVTAQRMKNPDLEQVAVVALLQREAGGNMAEVLDQVIANIRARVELRRLVRVLTAQGRLARWIITAIPIVLLVFLLLVNPDHLQPLFHDTLGQVALVMSAIMVVAGSLVIKKIVDITV